MITGLWHTSRRDVYLRWLRQGGVALLIGFVAFFAEEKAAIGHALIVGPYADEDGALKGGALLMCWALICAAAGVGAYWMARKQR